MILRRRLLDLVSDAPLVAVEAPSGYGKSTFIDQLVASSSAVRVSLQADDRSVQRLAARMVEAAAAAGVEVAAGGEQAPSSQIESVVVALGRSLPAGSWLTLDDLHHASDDVASVLAQIAAAVSEPGALRVVLSGRVLPWRPAGAPLLTEADLAFDRDETDTVFGGASDGAAEDAALCRRRTGGWPAAVSLWAHHTTQAALVADEHTVFDALLATSLSGIPADRLPTLALLPLLSERVGELLGWPGLVGDLVRCGLPVRRVGSWWTLGDVARDRLPRHDPLSRDLAAAVAREYAGQGQLLDAIDLLFAADARHLLPAVLAPLPPSAFDHHDLNELAAALDVVPDHVMADQPDAWLLLAQTAEMRAMLPLRGRLLDRLERAAIDHRMRLFVEVERVRDLSSQAQIDEAMLRGAAVLAALPADAPIARARGLFALGWALSLSDEPRSLLEAARHFAESAGLARSGDRDDDRARALSALAYRVHLKRAEYDRAISRFEEALTMIRPGTTLWAATLSFLAEALVVVGRDGDALDALADARSSARRLGDVRMLAYCAWGSAKVMARRRDTAGLAHWLAEANGNRGDWFDHLTGAEFCAVAAELHAQCGDIEAARAWLERTYAHPRLVEYPDIAWPAECSIEVRAGDPAAAEQMIHRLLDEGYTEFRERWRYRLWLAWCRHRLGDAVGAATLVGSVSMEVASCGHPELPELHEPEMWAALRAAGEATSVVAGWHLGVLGAFVARCGDSEVQVPGGKPLALLKILAVLGRPVPVEEMAELLWPEVDPEVGRRRLRNVVARVRSAGDFLDRADDLLVLSAAVSVDLLDFESLAKAALRSTDAGRVAKATEALERYQGELLPADRFEEWTVLPRERVRTLAVRLAEVVLHDARERHAVDDSVAAIERMLAADPYADHWADEAAVLLDRAGHDDAARTWRARARRIRADLGVT